MTPQPTDGPLAGLTVLDLTWVLAAPYASMTLSDLGADVIKVERPPYGDISRTAGPFLHEESAYFFSVNRGKRSVSIDLRRPEGRELFLTLMPRARVRTSRASSWRSSAGRNGARKAAHRWASARRRCRNRIGRLHGEQPSWCSSGPCKRRAYAEGLFLSLLTPTKFGVCHALVSKLKLMQRAEASSV